MKKNKKYHFSVEGETELLYRKWLEKLINNSECAYSVSFYVKVKKDPLSFVKGLSIQSETKVFHLCDYESDEPYHQEQFKWTMDRMREAEKQGKQVTYQFGYSNFTFDLWIILHKTDCAGAFADRHQYLSKINAAFSENFENMDKYKKKENFERCLSKLTIDDVCRAVERAQKIMDHNKVSYSEIEYKKFNYYRENPSLEIGAIIGKILKECKLIS